MGANEQVECPRCGMRRGLTLHRIMASDAQECPRCWGKDGVEVPMAIYPPRWQGHKAEGLAGAAPGKFRGLDGKSGTGGP
jgi:hypothetical protein